jgi:hypothetical protein
LPATFAQSTEIKTLLNGNFAGSAYFEYPPHGFLWCPTLSLLQKSLYFLPPEVEPLKIKKLIRALTGNR